MITYPNKPHGNTHNRIMVHDKQTQDQVMNINHSESPDEVPLEKRVVRLKTKWRFL